MNMIALLLVSFFFNPWSIVKAQSLIDPFVERNIKRNFPDSGHTFLELHKKLCALNSSEKISNLDLSSTGLKIKSQKIVEINKIDAMNLKLEIELQDSAHRFNTIEIISRRGENGFDTLFSMYFVKKVDVIPSLNTNQMVFRSFTGNSISMKKCLFMSPTEFYKKGERADRLVYLELNQDGLVHRNHYSNQEPQTLAEIYKSQPNLHAKIRILQESNRRIKVGIIDSGVDYNHPAIAYKIERRYTYETEEKLLHDAVVSENKQNELDLRKFLIKGFDLRDKDSSPYDFDGIKKISHFHPYVDFHGTEVAHALTKDTDKIVLTVGKYNLISLFSIAKIIQEQVSQGARIINMSFNYSKLSQMLSLDTGIRNALKNNPDTLFVVAAGNEGKQKVTYPGSYPFPNIINVAATDSKGELWKHSNYGPTVFIAAQGVHKLFIPGNTDVTEDSSGTSFAAPVVSRLAALMLFENKDLTPSEIKQILCETADKKEALVGKLICPGIINEERALQSARTFVGSRSSGL